MASDDNPQPAVSDPVGKQLQRAREKAGLSVNDVANVQHLRCGIIQAIENGDYSKIDTELFLKGYVRAYANQVGLNADDVIAHLDQELEPLRQKREQEYEANPLVTIERRRLQKRRLGKWCLLLAAVVLAGYLIVTFGFGGYLGLSGHNAAASGPVAGQTDGTQVNSASTSDTVESPVREGSEPDQQPLQAPDSAEATPPETTNTIAGAESSGLESESGSGSGSEYSAEPEPEMSAPVVTQSVEPALAEPGPTPTAEKTGVLQITFTDDCWVQVRDATGDKLVNSLQRDGDRIDVSGELPLRVVIGAVDAVGSISFQGEALQLSNYRVVNNRSEFTLTI
jgi:cytoskeleton protein RodZ